MFEYEQLIFDKNVIVKHSKYWLKSISVQHMDKITRVNVILKGFIPVASLYGVVGSPSLFIRSFIGIIGKI